MAAVGAILGFLTSLGLRQAGVLYNKKILKYIFTPLTTISTIVLAIFLAPATFSAISLIVGLFFCLVGDSFLMIETDDKNKEKRLFKAGLFSFLFSQIAFILSFSQLMIPSFGMIPLVGCLTILLYIIHKVFKKVDATIYSAFLLTTIFCAICTGIWFLIIGSLLFLISDVLIAINAFYKKIPDSSFYVWCLYAPALLFLAVSLMLL